MLEKLILKFGAARGQQPLECPMKAMTVLVGPNNSGKSVALAELAQYVKHPDASGRKLIERVEVTLPQALVLKKALREAVMKDLPPLPELKSQLGLRDKLPKDPERSEEEIEEARDAQQAIGGLLLGLLTQHLRSSGKLDLAAIKRRVEAGQASSEEEAVRQVLEEYRLASEPKKFGEQVLKWAQEGLLQLGGYLPNVLGPYMIVLDGRTRLSLVDDQQAPHWRNKSDNPFINLLKHPKRLRMFREVVYKAFDHYPVIDTTQHGRTCIRMAKEQPGRFERSTTPKALKYFDQARSIHEFSDGVKSFVGILAAVLGNDYKLVLIDEPEAFLHPPLARMLGTQLHRLVRERRAQVVAATHSPEFLMGCLQGHPDVGIVRLTYKNEQATARKLSPKVLSKMMKDPLLKSTGVMGALFHEGAVVSESDSDRAFYQEVNDRLLLEGRGARGSAFLNAQNKQTIHRIIEPLRKMGIPAAAIVDLDVLGNGGEMSWMLEGAGVSTELKTHLVGFKKTCFERILRHLEAARPDGSHAVQVQDEDARKKLKKKREEQVLAHLKREGLGFLPEQQRQEIERELLEPLARRGIFAVPCGELEGWLPELKLGRSDKARWLTHVFERMGGDPERPDEYMRPGSGDVWAFMARVATWIDGPMDGIPSET